ncbi:hypothetical protein PM082_006975 [Marasmius tenuissimus]|nr:hypothetical protein PM082_006975 [Marasmius tenuissimus]
MENMVIGFIYVLVPPAARWQRPRPRFQRISVLPRSQNVLARPSQSQLVRDSRKISITAASARQAWEDSDMNASLLAPGGQVFDSRC